MSNRENRVQTMKMQGARDKNRVYCYIFSLLCFLFVCTKTPGCEAQGSPYQQSRNQNQGGLPDIIKIGGLFDSEGATEEAAFKHAVERFNEESLPLSRFKFSAQIEHLLPRNSFSASAKVCQVLESGVAAIFGPQSSEAASHVQSICDAFEMPHVETKWDFKIRKENYLINLHLHPDTLSRAYNDLVEAFGWDQYVILYDDEESLFKIQALIKGSAPPNIFLYVKKYLKYYKVQNRPVNIILVDWSSAAKLWQKHGDTSILKRVYFPPAAYTQGVGLTTKLLIQKLRLRANITLDQMHLIGHSLGAQAMGYAGKILAQDEDSAKVGRISALDPAAPCFEDGAWLSSCCIDKPQGYESISKNDAKFVDAIHSNTACFGMTDPVGHVDFYPNGGNHQPGCTFVGICGLSCFVCSHSRSVDLMAASINGDKRDYRGVICPADNKKINSKACQSNREAKFNFLGHHVGKSEENHGVFYLATISKPPFSSTV